ncbi:MAG: DUF3379 family protein [Steroidobacteraceae bacterium]|nr:DUF3379 family protein [Steroidobacteraceae bacterium]
MNCTDAQVAIGAEPHSMTPELGEHLRTCAACAEYRREMIELDDRILRALRLAPASLKSDVNGRPAVRLVSDAQPAENVEPGGVVQPPRESRHAGNGQRSWALAASVVFAVAVMAVLWAALPRNTLAADIVAHVVSEPLPWPGAESPVSASSLAAIMKRSGLRLDPIDQDVLYAQTCFLRGRLVPHFVVQTDQGLVTVVIMPNEEVTTPQHLSEGGYEAVLYPHGERGSVAVLGRSRAEVDSEARYIASAVHFTGQ